MTPIQFSIPGQPQPKARPRFRVVTPKGAAPFVSTYTDPDTVKNEQRIADAAKTAMAGAGPVVLPVEVLIELRMQIPMSWSKKKQMAAATGQVRATKKPDADNCAKSVLDACNGIVFADDGQVVALTVRKLYHAVPAVVVAVRAVAGEAA